MITGEKGFVKTKGEPPRPKDYFLLVREMSKKACIGSDGFNSFSFCSGKINIRLLYSDRSIATAFTRSILHLETDPGVKSHLTIYCWDTFTTGMSPPFIPWIHRTYITSRETPYYSKDGIFILYKRESHILYLLDTTSNTAICWTEDAQQLPCYEKASPLRTIFQWMVLGRNSLCIHSAGVSVDGRGVLMTGTEKSGKSTTSLLCLMDGMDFAGDDYVLLSDEGSGYRVHSLYSSAKLDDDSLHILPQIKEYMDKTDLCNGEKAVFYFHEVYPERTVRSFTASAILLPVITGNNNSAIRRASAAEGIRALAPTTLFLQPGARKEAFRFLSEAVRTLPCYQLELGTDYSEIPGLIRKFIRTL